MSAYGLLNVDICIGGVGCGGCGGARTCEIQARERGGGGGVVVNVENIDHLPTVMRI